MFLKKALALVLACALVAGTATISASAAEGTVVNSVMGVEYSEAETIEAEATRECEVEASICSSFIVIIPKLITLSDEGEATYNVTVDADLAGTDYISVYPSAKEEGYVLKEKGGKADISYEVSQAKTVFIAEGSISEFTGATEANLKALAGSVEGYEIVTKEAAIVDGSVSAPTITAGIWSGSFIFNIAKLAKELPVSD